MQDPTFSAPGKFYRGNLHTHSNVSDGALAPQEVCKRYQDAGYDFIALTDHFVGAFDYPITDTASYRNDDFTTILGAELHSGATSVGDLWHILAVGLPKDFAPSNSPNFHPVEGQETGAHIAQRARDAGAYVAIAHPHWSSLTEADCRSIEAAHAVEIYNHGCEVDCDRGYGFHALDVLLSQNIRLGICATDDAHFRTHDYFGGWVMVKANELSPEALLQALKDGHHYSSQGPQLYDVDWQDKKVSVKCSPVETIIVQGRGIATEYKYGHGMYETSLDLRTCASSPWLRLTVVDKQGKKAWTQPVFRD